MEIGSCLYQHMQKTGIQVMVLKQVVMLKITSVSVPDQNFLHFLEGCRISKPLLDPLKMNCGCEEKAGVLQNISTIYVSLPTPDVGYFVELHLCWL